MFFQLPKKTLLLNILEILKKYTDQDHRLRQQEIINILERDYGMAAERKAVRRNLTNLMEMGYDINYDSGWYINRDFEDSEIRMLIDSLLFSKHIPYSQCRMLIEKLKRLSSIHFSARVSHIRSLPEETLENRQLFYTIDVLDEAISQRKQVAFIYNQYGIDKKMHPRRETKYVVNPYQIAATNDRYYLICNYDKYDSVSHYRLDRMTDIEMLPTPSKDMRRVRGLENGLDLPRHMAEHIYMFAGGSVPVRFRAQLCIVSDIVDWFGPSVVFSNRTQSHVDVSVRVNEDAMFCWAMQFGTYVEVLEPLSLRQKVKEAVCRMQQVYQDDTP
jgi:predicted DNA-binding transcriptional regulator YafY